MSALPERAAASLGLPLIAAAGLAGATWLVYIPAAKREAEATEDAGS
jgi:hypothetical protein